MEKMQRLLDQAGCYVRESLASEAASGEAFNIFHITKIERAEVNTHSAMIVELLNPRGSHGKGELFLKHLMSHMGIVYDCSLKEARVRKEQTFVDGQGRVDIVIHLRDHLILIENKVDAEDGDRQLQQYAAIGKTSGKTWHLWYLTKKGVDADECSHRGESYRRMSYREDILAWLEQCITSSGDIPALQHALIQYRNLVKKITGKTMTHNTNSKLTNLLSIEDNFKYADELARALPYAKGAVLFSFFEEIQNALASTHNCVRAPSGFPGIEVTEVSCNRWFMTGREKVHHVGLFFDIGVKGMLFRIEVASEALHYGVVPLSQSGDTEILTKGCPQLPKNLSYRGWKSFQWFSYLHQDNVASNMECLLKPDQVVSDVRNIIQQLIPERSAVCEEVCN